MVVAVAVGAVLLYGCLAAVAVAGVARRTVDLGPVGGAVVGLRLLCESIAAANEAEAQEGGEEAHVRPRRLGFHASLKSPRNERRNHGQIYPG